MFCSNHASSDEPQFHVALHFYCETASILVAAAINAPPQCPSTIPHPLSELITIDRHYRQWYRRLQAVGQGYRAIVSAYVLGTCRAPTTCIEQTKVGLQCQLFLQNLFTNRPSRFGIITSISTKLLKLSAPYSSTACILQLVSSIYPVFLK